MPKKSGMIDVSKKRTTKRIAKARATIKIDASIIKKIKDKKIQKGDPLEHARITGVLAAKNTSTLIPLCHPLMLDYIGIDFKLNKNNILINTEVISCGKTGVEMEALAAASSAALTIYDLCKMYTKDMEITDICLLFKAGGKSGIYKRKA